MSKLFSVVFLYLLNVLFVDSGNEDVTDKYLPLVMIQYDGSFQYPKELQRAILSQDQKSLHDVQFSRYNLHFNQIFFCPTDSPERKNQIEQANIFLEKSERLRAHYGSIKIGKNCLFESKFGKNEPVQCSVEAVPVIYEVTKIDDDRSNNEPVSVKCGPDKKGTLFQFVYDLCPPIKFFTRVKTLLWYIAIGEIRNFTMNVPFNYERQKIYEICYDLGVKRTIYTKHELSVVGLLRNKKLTHDREKKYSLFADDYGYEFFRINFQEDIEFYKKLANPSNEHDEIQTKPIYEPHQLVPSLDMMSAILGKPTFHYINIQPMHKEMTELWTYIEHLLKKNLDDESEIPLQVYTGAFDLSENSETTKIPNVWVKIIHMPRPKNTKWDFSLAIVMKNDYIFEDDTLLNRFCKVEDDHCDVFKQNEEVKESFTHRLKNLRCCKVNEYIDDLFGDLNFYENSVLRISDLTPTDPIPITIIKEPIHEK